MNLWENNHTIVIYKGYEGNHNKTDLWYFNIIKEKFIE